MLVIGKKEMANNTITLRQLDGKQEFDLSLDTLIKRAQSLHS
jgi:threonyl-tRNA synthetase